MSTDEWQTRYGSGYHAWRRVKLESKDIYVRPLGLVETLFDVDGTHYEGRADINALVTLKCNTTLSRKELQNWITLRWAALRCYHSLLRARVLQAEDIPELEGQRLGRDKCLVVDQPRSIHELVDEAKASMVLLEDYYTTVEADDFYRHAMNTARVFDASKALSKLFVFPLQHDTDGKYTLRLLLVAGHQIIDGLTTYAWAGHLISLLNQTPSTIEAELQTFLSNENKIFNRLPAAQEDLYPPIRGNKARQRWFWAISRILRHVRRPPPPGFPNPLRRSTPFATAQPMPPTYAAVLDYTKTPPLNSFTETATLSPHATRRLTRLCRAAHASIGAGCFALVALSLMDLTSALHPTVPAPHHLHFVSGFPLNPRPFLHPLQSTADSLMLFFSDGLALPYLPPSLPTPARFRLLAAQAHRQLSVFQKRPRTASQLAQLGSRSQAQLAPAAYLMAVERADAKAPAELRRGWDPQGLYAARGASGPGTCGVSSMGSRTALVARGRFGLELGGGRVFAADFRDLQASVRVRDKEFLVGSAGDLPESMHFSVSYDANAIDEGLVKRWKGVIEGLLEGGGGGGEDEEARL